MKTKYKTFFLITTILIAIFIFYMSSLTSEQTPKTETSLTPVIYHFIIFSLLCLSLLLYKNSKNKRTIMMLIAITIIYAISDEIHQLFVPGRFFSLADILTDTLGILLAGSVYSKFIANQKPSLKLY